MSLYVFSSARVRVYVCVGARDRVYVCGCVWVYVCVCLCARTRHLGCMSVCVSHGKAVMFVLSIFGYSVSSYDLHDIMYCLTFIFNTS